jgi:hypothetical protein
LYPGSFTWLGECDGFYAYRECKKFKI